MPKSGPAQLASRLANVHKVFLSHAAADKALVDDLKTMVQSAIGLAPGEFFYSSGKGTGIPAGQNFVDHIRDEMDGATFVVSIITPSFRESEFCLAELGAVWLLADKDFYPLCTPEVDRGDLKATLTGTQVERIDEASSLADLLQRLCSHFEREYNAAACTDAVNTFLATLPARLTNLSGATKVSADELLKANATVENLGQQVVQLRDEVKAEKERFELLKAAKTADEIEEIELADDVQERLEQLLERARDAVNDLDRDVRPAIPFAMRSDGMPWPDKGSWEYTDVEKQVDKGYLTDGEDGRVYLNSDWPVVEAAIGAVRELQDHLLGMSVEEEKWFRDTYGVPADLSQTAVFDELL